MERKIEVVYPKGRRITVKRFPTPYEIEHLKYLRNKMVEVKEVTTHNELEIKLYNKREQDSVKAISGGLYDFKEIVPSGAFIDIKMKCVDKELTQDINDVVRELSKKHLKPCISFPGRYTTQAKIDNVEFTEQIANTFYYEFANEIKKRIEHYKMNDKDEEDGYRILQPKQSFWKRLRGK